MLSRFDKCASVLRNATDYLQFYSYFEAFKKIEMRISLKSKEEPAYFPEIWKSFCSICLNSLHFLFYVLLIDFFFLQAATPTFNRNWVYLIRQKPEFWGEILQFSHVFLLIIFHPFSLFPTNIQVITLCQTWPLPLWSFCS